MTTNLVFFLAWITTSFLLTFYLKRKMILFKKIGTPVNFFGCSVIFLILHKVISDLLNTREITFLFLSIISFGIALSLIILNRKSHSKKKRTKKEITKIQKISAQSQLNSYNKNNSKNDY